MREFSSDIAFTPRVKTVQERRVAGELRSDGTGPRLADHVTPDLTAFLADLEMFYLQRPQQVSVRPAYAHGSSLV